MSDRFGIKLAEKLGQNQPALLSRLYVHPDSTVEEAYHQIYGGRNGGRYLMRVPLVGVATAQEIHNVMVEAGMTEIPFWFVGMPEANSPEIYEHAFMTVDGNDIVAKIFGVNWQKSDLIYTPFNLQDSSPGLSTPIMDVKNYVPHVVEKKRIMGKCI